MVDGGLKLPSYDYEQLFEFFQEIHGYKPTNLSPFKPRDGVSYSKDRIVFYKDMETADVMYIKNPEKYSKVKNRICNYTPVCDSNHAHAIQAGFPIFRELDKRMNRQSGVVPKTLTRKDFVKNTLESEQGDRERRTILIMKGVEGYELSKIYKSLVFDKMENLGRAEYKRDRIQLKGDAVLDLGHYGFIDFGEYEFKPTQLASAMGQLFALNELFLDVDFSARHLFYDAEKKEATWIDQGKAFQSKSVRGRETRREIRQIAKWAGVEEEAEKALDESINHAREVLTGILENVSTQTANHLLAIPVYRVNLNRNNEEYYEILNGRAD